APLEPPARSPPLCSRSRAGLSCSAGRSPATNAVPRCTPERKDDMARRGMLLLGLLLVVAPVHAKDTVVIYTAIEPEQITDYMKAVNKTLPNIEVKMLRLSTGDISARFMA